jgi:hypothetical protein
MQDDSSRSDPRIIWQNQPSELSTMTLEKIRQRARELHAKTRRELLKNIATPLIVVAFAGLGIILGDNPLQRTAFALALIWSLTGQYFLNRGMWSATLPGEAGSTTGLESYRREIQWRRDLFRRALGWSFGPVFLAIAALILPIVAMGIRNRGPLRNMVPFLTLIIVWLAAVPVIRMRGQRELQREIEELNEIEKANR